MIGKRNPFLGAVAPALLLACAGAVEGSHEAGAPSPVTEVQGELQLVPPGYGTLRQDEVTVDFRVGALLIKVTPLAEAVTRLTAPDTYERLSGLARSYGGARDTPPGSRELLFLVSFFSYEPDVVFQPEDLLLVNQGLRYRPRTIRAVTPGWGAQRLGQQETQLAIYAFDPAIDLGTDLEVEYRDTRDTSWEAILPVIQAERAKVLARAGGP
jgi:hypothetical protein